MVTWTYGNAVRIHPLPIFWDTVTQMWRQWETHTCALKPEENVERFANICEYIFFILIQSHLFSFLKFSWRITVILTGGTAIPAGCPKPTCNATSLNNVGIVQNIVFQCLRTSQPLLPSDYPEWYDQNGSLPKHNKARGTCMISTTIS